MPPIKGDDGTTSGIPVPPPGTFGVLGDSKAGFGVVGTSGGPAAVYGESNSDLGSAEFGYAGSGVLGVNKHRGGVGVRGQGSPGVLGEGYLGVSGVGSGDNATGVGGTSDNGAGVAGWSNRGPGVWGGSDSSNGVVGYSRTGTGVYARGIFGILTHGESFALAADGASGYSASLGTPWHAGFFFGPVHVNGNLSKAGGGFLIDHPSDPANQYLSHAFVESPDRKNIYDGIAELDGQGEAVVELPDWFSTLNRDFRYQLTCVGGQASVFVAQEINNNRFRIAGGSRGLKVSWQVTGIRQDPWAKANPVDPAAKKPEKERGTFLHPELHGQPKEKSLHRALHPQPPEPPKEPQIRPKPR
jgi:hypothetical protein